MIDFSVPAAEIATRINGLFPWPCCAVEIAGLTVKFGLADVAETGPGGLAVPSPPGEVLGADAAGLLVGTGAGGLRVRRLQRPGGRMLPAAEFLRGFAIPSGTRLASHPMPALLVAR